MASNDAADLAAVIPISISLAAPYSSIQATIFSPPSCGFGRLTRL